MWKSFQIAKAFGIPVKLHWSFFLVFVMVGYIAWDNQMNQTATIILFGLAIATFICVVLHEYGHALMAKRFGVKTRDIILAPIGGVARLEGLPEKPMQEFWIALAGPLVNFIIVICCLPYFIFNSPEELLRLSSIIDPLEEPAFFVPLFMLGNLVVGLFNLVPVFPLDGGRVFRSLLSIKMTKVKATRIASFIGQIGAVIMIASPLYLPQPSVTLPIIGCFIFFMARQENRAVKYQSTLRALRKIKVGDLLRGNFTPLYHHHPISTAIEQLKNGLERNFLVFDLEGNFNGVLTDYFTKKRKKAGALTGYIGDYTTPVNIRISEEENLGKVIHYMQQLRLPMLPIHRGDDIVGVIDYERMMRFVDEK